VWLCLFDKKDHLTIIAKYDLCSIKQVESLIVVWGKLIFPTKDQTKENTQRNIQVRLIGLKDVLNVTELA